MSQKLADLTNYQCFYSQLIWLSNIFALANKIIVGENSKKEEKRSSCLELLWKLEVTLEGVVFRPGSVRVAVAGVGENLLLLLLLSSDFFREWRPS